MTHANLAFAMLIAGDFIGGFAQYEWRRKSGPIARAQRDRSQPEWQPGDVLAGKTLLLHPEQGYGDAIHFARFVPLLTEEGARIVLEVPAGLETLCRTIASDIVVVRSGDPLPHFDLHAPLMSLAHKLRITPDSIPARVPYLFASADKRATWARRLSRLSPGLRVGLCWSGNPAHRNDRARSIALSELATLLDVPGISFISLQREVRATDAAPLVSLPIAQMTEHIADFSDTAALVAALDLVVTVDTSIAHLAGALAKPVWIMIPSAPDWRWLRRRADSPWYPTARLFRQREPENWKPVLAEIREALQKLATT